MYSKAEKSSTRLVANLSPIPGTCLNCVDPRPYVMTTTLICFIMDFSPHVWIKATFQSVMAVLFGS